MQLLTREPLVHCLAPLFRLAVERWQEPSQVVFTIAILARSQVRLQFESIRMAHCLDD